MSLSRSGFELNEIWNTQANLIEAADERARRLARSARGSDPGKRDQHLHALHRRGATADELAAAGFHKEAMKKLVDHHHNALHAYNASRRVGSNAPSEDAWKQYAQARGDIRRHHQQHGEHPADHVRRESGETARDFGNRLIDLSQANGSHRTGGSEHDHGTISYDHDEDDEHGHKQRRNTMIKAWNREVPEGHVSQGIRRHGDGSVKGSFVGFRTGPRRH